MAEVSQVNSNDGFSTYKTWRTVTVQVLAPLAIVDYAKRIVERFNSEPSVSLGYDVDTLVKYFNTLVSIRVSRVRGDSRVGNNGIRNYPIHPTIPSPVATYLQQLGLVKFPRMGYEYLPIATELDILEPEEFVNVSYSLFRMPEFGLGQITTEFPRDEKGDPQFMSIEVDTEVVTSDPQVHYSQAQLAAFYTVKQQGSVAAPLLTFGDVNIMRRRVDEFIR